MASDGWSCGWSWFGERRPYQTWCHFSSSNPQYGLGAVLPRSNTPSLRVAGFEDEYEAPCEGTSHKNGKPRVKALGEVLSPLRGIKRRLMASASDRDYGSWSKRARS